MINEKELQISKKSYINKDFASIYPELLDIWKKLTNKFDPETSNESDPGVVLTKLLAFIADKLNYNVDKNVLERFMLSATQESSMAELCEMVGYNMDYYISSSTHVTFTYVGDKLNSESTSPYFEIPKFSVLSSVDGDVSYITTVTGTISRETNFTVTVPVIEGSLKDLIVEDSDVIRLNNLDDRNRVYFPVSAVAQNGVFITNLDEEVEWDRVMMLNSQKLGQKIYKFGYDSHVGRPYIEFPEDIANLIGNGLTIKYVISKGVNGNIKANTLKRLLNPSELTVQNTGSSEAVVVSADEDNTELVITNTESAILGRNPQTIDEAYNAYKKVAGTFDTLVTTRDYANFIYNMTDEDGFPVVSNVQVSDRRDDFNFAHKVVTYDINGTKYEVIPTKTSGVDDLTAFDLCLYPLKPIVSYVDDGETQYNDSFTKLGNNSYIKDRLENSKSISHDYKDLDKSKGVYLFRIDYDLNANISTTYKVNTFEQAEILRNVKKALINKFNSRNVDYGYEIPFDTILETIEQADARISAVSLAEPKLSVVPVTFGTGKEEFDVYIDLIVSNVLAGRVQLFEYEDRFDYELGQENTNLVEKVEYIETHFNLPVTNLNEYQLKENEVIQLIAPSYINNDEFGVYCLFSYYNSDSSATITNNSIHKLTNNEYLYVRYVDSSDTVQEFIYKAGDIIQPVGFDITVPDFTLSPSADKYRPCSYKKPSECPKIKQFINEHSGANIAKNDAGNYVFHTLTANESIQIKELNQVTLVKPVYCYWIRNNADNKLFDGDGTNKTITLRDGEYFFYTDYGFTNLVTIGSGTTIEIADDVFASENPKASKDISLSDIENNGILNLKDKWIYATCNENGQDIHIIENSILTLTDTDTITINNPSMTETVLSNEFVPITFESLSYVIDGTTSSLSTFEVDSSQWKIRSRLDLNVSKEKSQTLGSYQSVTLFPKSSVTGTPITSDQHFNASLSLQEPGEDKIYVAHTDLVSGDEIYPDVYIYELGLDEGVTETPVRDAQDYAQLVFTESKYTYKFSIPSLTSIDNSLLMIYWSPNSSEDLINITVSNGSGTITEYPNGTFTGTEGMHILNIPNTVEEITISSEQTGNSIAQGSLIVDKIRLIKGYNPYLGIEELAEKFAPTTESIIETAIENKLKNMNFYYTNRINNDSALALDEDTSLISPYAFFDSNNIANKFALPRIKLDSPITIARSSKK